MKSLKFLRGTNKVDGELEEIRKFVNESKTKNFSWRVLKSRAAIKSVLIGFWLMVFQQFGGANAVVFNATTIFQVSRGEETGVRVRVCVWHVTVPCNYPVGGWKHAGTVEGDHGSWFHAVRWQFPVDVTHRQTWKKNSTPSVWHSHGHVHPAAWILLPLVVK